MSVATVHSPSPFNLFSSHGGWAGVGVEAIGGVCTSCWFGSGEDTSDVSRVQVTTSDGILVDFD